MSQTINFLRDLPKSTSRLSAGMIGLIVCSFVGILVIITGILSLINFQIYKKMEVDQKRRDLVLKEYLQLAKAYPLLASNISFVKKVKSLEAQFKAKKAEIDSLEHLIVRPGFFEYMSDLTQVTPATVWLNQIQINQDVPSITLNGYTIHPDAVSELMNGLLTSNAFKNVVFNLFFVKTIKNHSYLKFSIATKDLGSTKEAVNEQADEAPKKVQGEE